MDRWIHLEGMCITFSVCLCVKVKFCWFLRFILFDYFLLFLVSCCHPNFVLLFFCVFFFDYSFDLSISLFPSPSPSLSYLPFFISLFFTLSSLECKVIAINSLWVAQSMDILNISAFWFEISPQKKFRCRIISWTEKIICSFSGQPYF